MEPIGLGLETLAASIVVALPVTHSIYVQIWTCFFSFIRLMDSLVCLFGYDKHGHEEMWISYGLRAVIHLPLSVTAGASNPESLMPSMTSSA